MNDEELRKKERDSKIFKMLVKLFKEDDVFWNNEIQANLFVSTCLLAIAFILILSYFLAYIGVFDVPIERMKTVLMVNLPLLIGGNLLSAAFKGKRHFIKYVLCFVALSASVGLCGVISIFVPIIICIPVVLSCRYYSRKFTNQISVLTIIGMAVSEVIYAKRGMLDMNLVGTDPGMVLHVGEEGLRGAMLENGYDKTEYLINLFRGSFMPRLLLFSVVAIVCSELARRAHEMVLDQAEISRKTEGIKSELAMATNIQAAVLPKIFPPFPERPDLDLHASMDPAKEVGGDFYDYYLLDDDHLMIVIADVSGKGVPAALFMMISKMLIKTHAYIDRSPAKIAEAVNVQLCDKNETDMFVTAWIGVLEISTGIVTAVDAGHEYPLIRHGSGDYEVLKDKKCFVLAGMENAKYEEYSFKLERDDRMFWYTDGAAEATNDRNELYGMKRLLECVNNHKEESPKELLVNVRREIDDFVGNAPQFDDLTMVALHFRR